MDHLVIVHVGDEIVAVIRCTVGWSLYRILLFVLVKERY